MDKKKLFRFEIEIEATFRVEKVKDADYGKERYLKQLVSEFIKDPEALHSFILTNFIDIYWAEPQEELHQFLGNQENSQAVILRLAKKCTPETYHYFSDLFAALPGKETMTGDEEEESLSAAGPDPDRVEKEEEWDKIRELEWVYLELNNRLCKFTPVNAVFREAPAKKRQTSPGVNQGVYDMEVKKKNARKWKKMLAREI